MRVEHSPPGDKRCRAPELHVPAFSRRAGGSFSFTAGRRRRPGKQSGHGGPDQTRRRELFRREDTADEARAARPGQDAIDPRNLAYVRPDA